ncbi:MAG: ribonuclease Z [Spirochaetales bacterium]|nr:ribonuclease Z [Spirochaetales bacterium]
MSLEVFVLGTGGMMPLPHRHLTSALVRREGDLFLFDCGEGTQVALKKLNLRWKKISAIFISHTHADHVTGLPGMLMLSSQVDRTDPLYLIGPPRLKEYYEVNRRSLEMYVNYEIIVHEISNPSEPQVVFKGDGYQVRSFPLNHSRVCVGYTLEEELRPGIFHPEKARELGVPMGPFWAQLQAGEAVTVAGRTVTSDAVLGPPRSGVKFSYVTDTAPLASIAGEVKDSDLLLCEGMFTRDLEAGAREKKHLTSTQAAEIATGAGGVASLGLFHYSPRCNEKELKRLLTEAREVFPNAFLARDGQIIDLPNHD